MADKDKDVTQVDPSDTTAVETPQVTPKPKKRDPLLIAMIVVGALIVLVMLVGAVAGIFKLAHRGATRFEAGRRCPAYGRQYGREFGRGEGREYGREYGRGRGRFGGRGMMRQNATSTYGSVVVHGEVVTVADTTITIKGTDGKETKATIASGAKIQKDGTTAKVEDIKAGQKIAAVGELDNGTLSAKLIVVLDTTSTAIPQGSGGAY